MMHSYTIAHRFCPSYLLLRIVQLFFTIEKNNCFLGTGIQSLLICKHWTRAPILFLVEKVSQRSTETITFDFTVKWIAYADDIIIVTSSVPAIVIRNLQVVLVDTWLFYRKLFLDAIKSFLYYSPKLKTTANCQPGMN
jgi:hypothetical protein